MGACEPCLMRRPGGPLPTALWLHAPPWLWHMRLPARLTTPSSACRRCASAEEVLTTSTLTTATWRTSEVGADLAGMEAPASAGGLGLAHLSHSACCGHGSTACCGHGSTACCGHGSTACCRRASTHMQLRAPPPLLLQASLAWTPPCVQPASRRACASLSPSPPAWAARAAPAAPACAARPAQPQRWAPGDLTFNGGLALVAVAGVPRGDLTSNGIHAHAS